MLNPAKMFKTMKRIGQISRIVVAVVIMMSSFLTANAEGFKFGVKGGLTFGELKFDGENIFEKYKEGDQRLGWNVGLTMQYVGSSGFGLDLSILYARNEYGYWDRDRIKNDMIDLPIHVVYHIPVGINKQFSPYLYTGPDFMFSVKDTGSMFYDYYYDDYYYGYRYEPVRCVFSWNVGIGVMLFNHLQVQGGYTFGISNSFEGNSDTSYGKGRVWSVSAAVVF